MALLKARPQVILNAAGKPIELTADERENAQYWQREINSRFRSRLQNALGYEVPITTLTAIVKKVSEMKLYEIPFAKFVPVVIGQNTWGSSLTTFRSFDVADDFETGIINTGGDNSKQPSVNAAIDSMNVKIYPWAKTYGWSIFELQEAAKSGNWNLVAAKEKSRKRNWDLGIQRIAFLGAKGLNSASGPCLGLLNQPGVTFDATLVTQRISTMSYTQLAAFQAAVLGRYRANCNYTAYPTHFVIPESDYNGLAAQSSPQFPGKSFLELLRDGFKVITQNDGFQILPLAYADVANAGGALPTGAATCMYALYRYDEESVNMNLPLDYTATLANSMDNFNFQNSAYGQFTGVQALRPAELYYAGF